MSIQVVILAAGKGKRMKSDLPKPLHELLGKTLIDHVLDAASEFTDLPPVLVVGHEEQQIRDRLGERVRYVVQKELLGTGDAVRQAEELIGTKAEQVLVLYGDMPLVTGDTIKAICAAQVENSGPMTLLTVTAEDPRGFGRIVRDPKGAVQGIVEQADATPEQLLIKELNAGIYCFDSAWLWPALGKLELSPKGEYYLTDLAALAVQEGNRVASVEAEDPSELIGINTRVHLAEAAQLLQTRINRNWMMKGVTILDPASTFIDPDAEIGQDTILLPNSHIQGQTVIGRKCRIGPGCRIFNSQLGDACEVEYSVIEESRLEDKVDVGPYSHLRKGAHLGKGVHVGNFGEVKDSYLGEGSKMGHFSYIGNAKIGRDVNIGAGTITCNYDGKQKHQTVIHDGVFIGSDSMLVAPLEIGRNATTGAGSVVTKDVPPDTTVVGVPARQISKKKKKD